MDELDDWNRRTAARLEEAYLAAGAGPGGSGSSDQSAGAWRAKRRHLAHPVDRDGPWLDVGCANGHLLVTLPEWARERGVTVHPHGLELLPRLAALARSLHPQLVDSIGTGDVMTLRAAVGATGPTVPVDIKPRSCPNPLNVGSLGVLPVALLGTPDFDVAMVDPASVTLEGVPALRWDLDDVATPYGDGGCLLDCRDCHREGADGELDLSLKFDRPAIVAALGAHEDGECRVLRLEATLLDGTVVTGGDVVWIKVGGR